MSKDLTMLQSASAMRTWEERRARQFGSWVEVLRSLVTGLRSAFRQGAARNRSLEEFLRCRSAAEQSYSKALAVSAALLNGDDGRSSAPQKTVGSPLLLAMMGIQDSISKARAAFSAALLESVLLSGVEATTDEFEKMGLGVVLGLEQRLDATVETHEQAQEAMAAYHRFSIEGRRRCTKDDKEPPDAWLQEHRYRRCLAVLRERQALVMSEAIAAVQEAWRLEEWREEMVGKTLSKFCARHYQAETTVQSLANDGVRELANHRPDDPGEQEVLHVLEHALRTCVDFSSSPSARGPGQVAATDLAGRREPVERWPLLAQAHELGRWTAVPETLLGRMGGAFITPGRWFGKQLCAAFLTKDDWMHCFHLPTPLSAASASSAPKQRSRPGGRSEDGLTGADFVEGEPVWSIYVPGSRVVSPVSGFDCAFQLEEQSKGMFRKGRKELLQLERESDIEVWLAALAKAGAVGNASYAALLNILPHARQPPQPAPPPPSPALRPPEPPPPPTDGA